MAGIAGSIKNSQVEQKYSLRSQKLTSAQKRTKRLPLMG
jgi:hypothetical protein